MTTLWGNIRQIMYMGLSLDESWQNKHEALLSLLRNSCAGRSYATTVQGERLIKVPERMLSCVLAWPNVQGVEMTRRCPSGPHCEPEAIDVVLFPDNLLHRDHQPVQPLHNVVRRRDRNAECPAFVSKLLSDQAINEKRQKDAHILHVPKRIHCHRVR